MTPVIAASTPGPATAHLARSHFWDSCFSVGSSIGAPHGPQNSQCAGFECPSGQLIISAYPLVFEKVSPAVDTGPHEFLFAADHFGS